MRHGIVRNKKGMALVMAIMTAFILMALVASLFWVISATQRQAEYARNGAIALNLAEAGVADAIYRLNYCTGITATDNYPFSGTFVPFGTTASDTAPIGDLPDLPPDPNPIGVPDYAPAGIRGTLGGGHYAVGLLDANSSDDTKTDTIISVGVYKGTKRLLTVPVRGTNDTGTTRHTANQGISEALNKHVIYSDKVTPSGTPSVTGNIVYTDASSTFTGITGTYTKTLIAPSLFGIPTPNSTSVVSGSALIPLQPPPPPPYAVGVTAFKDDDGGPSSYTAASGYAASFPGGYTNDTYTLNSFCTIPVGDTWRFEKGGANPLTVVINFASAPTISGKIVVYDGSMSITGNGTAYTIGDSSLDWVLWVDEDINIVGSGGITVDGTMYSNGTGIATNGIRITNTSGANTIKDWIISGKVIMINNGNTVGQSIAPTGMIANGKITIRGGTIYGGVASGSEIELRDNAVTIDATNSDSALVVSSSTTATATILVAPTLNYPALSTNTSKQRAALTAFGTSTVNVTISADFQPNYNGKSRPAIVALSSGGSASVTVNTAGTDVTGGIYCGSGGGNLATITLGIGIGTVSGLLIAGDPNNPAKGLVNLQGGTLTFDNSIYTGADPSSDFYPGFSGGRRVYVPLWRVWGLK